MSDDQSGSCGRVYPVTEEIAHVTTDDGYVLSGALFTPGSEQQRGAVILVHGWFVNFSFPTYVKIARILAAAGYVTLSGDTRGHDVAALMLPDSNSGTERARVQPAGTIWERFLESPLDIGAWIAYLNSRGHKRVVLFGHSAGAHKVAYYQATTQDPGVVGLIIGSPSTVIIAPDISRRREAERLVAKERGADLLPAPDGLPAWWMDSAEHFLQETDVSERIFVSPEPNPLVGTIREPILAFRGTHDGRFSPAEGLEALRRNAARAEVHTVEGANHNYIGSEVAVAELALGWLARLEQTDRDVGTQVADTASITS